MLDGPAALDLSHLVAPPDLGAPLFAAETLRVCVHVPARSVSNEADLARVRAVLDREAPAHVACAVRVYGARMRVGAQARLGLDTIVAGPARPLALPSASGLGVETPLGPPEPRRLGLGARLGGPPAPPLGGFP